MHAVHPYALMDQHINLPNRVSCMLSPRYRFYNRSRYHSTQLPGFESQLDAMLNNRRHVTFDPSCLGQPCCSIRSGFQQRNNVSHPLAFLFDFVECCERSDKENEDKLKSGKEEEVKPKDKCENKPNEKAKSDEIKKNTCSSKETCSSNPYPSTSTCEKETFELDPVEYLFNIFSCLEKYQNGNVLNRDLDNKEINPKDKIKPSENTPNDQEENKDNKPNKKDNAEVISKDEVKSVEIEDENLTTNDDIINDIPNPPSFEKSQSTEIKPTSDALDHKEMVSESANEAIEESLAIEESRSSFDSLENLVIKRKELEKTLELLDLQMSELEKK